MSGKKKPGKPLPKLDEENRWFWEACGRHELVLQKCGACGRLRYHPRALCPACLSDDVVFVRCSGRGTVHTFTVTHQNQSPGFREELPYVMAWVELEEGPRVLTNVVDCPPDQVRIGLPVVVTFEDVAPEIAVPRFRPA